MLPPTTALSALVAFYAFLILSTHSLNLSVDLSISPGYHYNHFCELTLTVISDQLQVSRQVFNFLSSTNNSSSILSLSAPPLFYDGSNPYYTLGIDGREDMTYSFNGPCLFKRTSQFFCMYITPDILSNFSFAIPVNKTFYKYVTRISKVLCPASSNPSSPFGVRVQIPGNYYWYDKYSYASSF